MKKRVLKEKTELVKNDTTEALSLMFNELNNGQQKKLLKNDKIKELLIRYKVIEE